MILLALVLAGGILRFATLGTQSFWIDEAIAIHSARLDLSGLIDSLARTEGNPPLYFVLLDGWMRLFGDSEAAIRSLSALFGTATILVAYAIGRRLASSTRVGLAAAALAAFNPLLVWFSQEARPYALLVLLAGLSFLLFAEALERPTARVLGGWALASGLALATHYFAGILIVPEALWLLHRVRPRRHALLAVAGFSIVPLALIPLVADQGQVQDYSFVKGEGLVSRVVAQVPKQMLVGYDAPYETAAVVLAGALTAVAVWLALTRAEGRERRALALGAGAGLGAVALAAALALAGADYFLSRYLLSVWLPLALVAAAGLGARRSGRLGVAVGAALCALFAFVVVSVAARPELQRDDWRGIARALGPPAGGRAIIVSPINGSIPLSLYLPGQRALGPSGATVQEVDAVAVAPHVAGEERRAPVVPAATPPAGFREVARHRGRTYTVVRYRSDAPVLITPVMIGSLALLPGSPDYVLQN
ncbi:MAG: mannosyltransferase [Thermoleophilaceae bacterium]|nr:mannosyltransferase [Thermoleophilaceae bacterium]